MADTRADRARSTHGGESGPAATDAPTESPVTRPRRPNVQSGNRRRKGDRPQGIVPQGDRPQGAAREGSARAAPGRWQGRRWRSSQGRGGPHEWPRRRPGRARRARRRRRRGGDRGRFEGPPEIDIEKLISDPLYLDNQAHGVVSRMRDMDSGTKSQLRRLYNAVRRAVRAPENERQQQFVMLRARLAYTIARHSLRSLDSLEKLLLQVTRKNDARGYERFRDLFEAIVAYNE